MSPTALVSVSVVGSSPVKRKVRSKAKLRSSTAFHIQSRATTGELTPVEFVRADEHEIVALAAAANGGRMEVTIGVEPDPPHRLTALRLVPAETGG